MIYLKTLLARSWADSLAFLNYISVGAIILGAASLLITLTIQWLLKGRPPVITMLKSDVIKTTLEGIGVTIVLLFGLLLYNFFFWSPRNLWVEQARKLAVYGGGRPETYDQGAPRIVPEVYASLITKDDNFGKVHSVLFAWVCVRNYGIPSVFENIALVFDEGSEKKEVRTRTIGDDISVFLPNRYDAIGKFQKDDQLLMKTGTKPVDAGTHIHGWLIFILPDGMDADSLKGKVAKLYGMDAFGKFSFDEFVCGEGWEKFEDSHDFQFSKPFFHKRDDNP